MCAKCEYPGYPQIVVIGFPKTGTKTMNKCFTEDQTLKVDTKINCQLGYKVFDNPQILSYHAQLDAYGKKEIEFDELAKIWEDNHFDVIIEPAALYWLEMAQHWPKTKLINLVRDDAETWARSLKGFIQEINKIPDDHLLDQILANNQAMSPTAYSARNGAMECYVWYAVGYHHFTRRGCRTWAEQEPWERMMIRKYRMFQADVQVNAPKERTLFNYNVKSGWPILREFLGLQTTSDDDQFPHENKSKNTADFVAKLWNNCNDEYDAKVESELITWMKRNGYDCKKIHH